MITRRDLDVIGPPSPRDLVHARRVLHAPARHPAPGPWVGLAGTAVIAGGALAGGVIGVVIGSRLRSVRPAQAGRRVPSSGSGGRASTGLPTRGGGAGSDREMTPVPTARRGGDPLLKIKPGR